MPETKPAWIGEFAVLLRALVARGVPPAAAWDLEIWEAAAVLGVGMADDDDQVIEPGGVSFEGGPPRPVVHGLAGVLDPSQFQPWYGPGSEVTPELIGWGGEHVDAG